MISELIDLSDRLHFPEIDEAKDILLSETGYIETMSPQIDDYYMFNNEKNERYLKSEMIQQWTVKERDKLIKLTMEFENQFETYGIKFDDSIEMIKIASGSRLPDVFISENAIVLTQDAVDMHKDNLKDELVQSYFKLYLSKHPHILDDMSAMLGFTELESLSLKEYLIDDIVIRPDIIKPYIYEARRGDVEVSPPYNWVPVTFINPVTKGLEDHMLAVTITTNGEAIASTVTTQNMYLPEINDLSSHMAVPLSKLEDAYKNFGEIPEFYTHPEDILALNFMYLILDRPVTGTGTVDKLKAKLES